MTHVKHEYGLNLSKSFENNYQAIILAVSHDEFLNIDMERLSSKDFVFFDIKAVVDKNKVDARL